jgi:hypothetical protein
LLYADARIAIEIDGPQHFGNAEAYRILSSRIERDATNGMLTIKATKQASSLARL